MKTALLIIDIQNDFLPGGALGIENGDLIIPIINKIQDKFDIVIATKDWHPQNHLSFASQHRGKKILDTIILEDVVQTLWPEHCVQDSYGSELSSKLDTDKISKITYKGTNERIDSYSAFMDNKKEYKTDLEDYLKSHNVDTVYISGLATDYCIKYSANDCKNAGFETYVIEDACAGVNRNDSIVALEEMRQHGIHVINSEDL